MNGNMELTRLLSPLPVEPCPVFVTLVSTIHNSVDVYKGGVARASKMYEDLVVHVHAILYNPKLFENEAHSSFTPSDGTIALATCCVWQTVSCVPHYMCIVTAVNFLSGPFLTHRMTWSTKSTRTSPALTKWKCYGK